MIVNINDFEQGSASGDSLYNVRSGYIRENITDFVNISATSTTGNELQVELLGYSDINSNSFLIYVGIIFHILLIPQIEVLQNILKSY